MAQREEQTMETRREQKELSKETNRDIGFSAKTAQAGVY